MNILNEIKNVIIKLCIDEIDISSYTNDNDISSYTNNNDISSYTNNNVNFDFTLEITPTDQSLFSLPLAITKVGTTITMARYHYEEYDIHYDPLIEWTIDQTNTLTLTLIYKWHSGVLFDIKHQNESKLSLNEAKDMIESFLQDLYEKRYFEKHLNRITFHKKVKSHL